MPRVGDARRQVAEGGEEEQPQANRADMEIAEQIFRAVSEECREELQKSMSERSELSDECRNEIQEAISSGKVKVPQNAQAPPQEAEEEAPVPLYANPVVHVSVFLVVFFAAIGGYVYYVDTELKKVRPADPKKNKKKKKKSKKEGAWSIGDM